METNQETNSSRLGLFGDIPTRFLVWILKTFPILPSWIEAPLIYLGSFLFYLIARPQRDGIRHNLSHIYHDLGFVEGYFRAYIVFCNFAFAYVDSQRAKLNQDVIEWELDGYQQFEELNHSHTAAMIFTTHTGNYDLAAKLFVTKSKRALHTVRLPEKSSHMNKLREAEFRKHEEQHPMLKILYNREGNMLGVELLKILNDNGLVAVQSDRVMHGISPLTVSYSAESNIFLPKGPLTLACVSKCPCYPLFVVRTAYRKYKVIVQPPLAASLPDGQRRLREIDIAKAWVERFRMFIEPYAGQWFVLEKHFEKKTCS